MTRVRLAALLAAISLGCVTAIHAHHSSGMFELTNAIWMQGTIVRFDRINPHSIITLEEKTRDGQVRRWAIEGPDAGQLNRRGVALDFLKAGSDLRFQETWCVQRGRKPTQDDESLRTYVDEMTRVLNRPCG